MCRKMIDNGLLSFLCSVPGEPHEGPCATPEVARSMEKRRQWVNAQAILRQSQGKAVTVAEGLHADPSAVKPHPALARLAPTPEPVSDEFEVDREFLDRDPKTAAWDQPPPTHRDDVTSIQDLVIADIEERKRVGMERYGTLLKPFNGRDALMDLYQELLDACQYVRQAIEEREQARSLLESSLGQEG